TLCHLTTAGAELEPALEALGVWGIRYMAKPADHDEFRSHWFAFPISLFLHDRDPDGPPIAIELRAAGRPAVIEVSGGSVCTRLGTTPAPDLVLRGTPQLILGLISAHLTPGQAQEAGLEIEGNVGVLARLQPASAGAD